MKISELKERVSIERVLERYGWVDDTSSWGDGWASTHCPFHDDATASAQVNLLDNRFRCFGCDISGDVLDIVEGVELLSVKDAIRFLEENFLG